MIVRDRQDECAVLDRLLEGARAGRSGVLVMRGEAGVGKTALLDYAVASASDLRVLRAVGVESEMELAFAALHQLCAPLLDRLERLPGPQRDALADHVRAERRPGAGSLSSSVWRCLVCLSEAAEERPLLCVVDDAQWLDQASAQALAFVARRLLAESVVMLFAAREPSDVLAGLPELRGRGASRMPMRGSLLASVIPGRLDERVADALLAETRGNPLALLELPRGLSAGAAGGRVRIAGSAVAVGQDRGELPAAAGGAAGGHPAALAGRGGGADRRSGALVARGRAARDHRPGARAGGVGRADRGRQQGALSPSAGALGGVPGGDAAATAAGAPGVGGGDRRAASIPTGAPGTWPRRRPDPDEDVAAELERAAGRAQARGGLAAAAAFLERAAALTPEPSRRAQRALAAAQTKYEAGALDDALALLADSRGRRRSTTSSAPG